MRTQLFMALSATTLLLATASEALAWGAYHVGYSHYGSGGYSHYGRTSAYGAYGGYSGEHYGYRGGYGGSSYHTYGYHTQSSSSSFLYPPSSGNAYGYGGMHYGGYSSGGYRAGVYRRY